MTQKTCAVRLKFVKLGDADLKNLYAMFDQLNNVDFQAFCCTLVNSGSGGKAKKIEIVNSINQTVEKHKMLKTAQDFILAGMGLGV